MAQGLLLWSPNPCHNLRTPPHSLTLRTTRARPAKQVPPPPPISAAAASDAPTQAQGELSARERRRLRNERRESKMGTNWREEVEMSLLKKPKKPFATWTEKLNLDNLADLGPQWWVVKVSRARGHDTADLIARLLARNFPNFPFKVYAPSVKVKRKLKNGVISVKPKPLFPGCVFLRCLLNKEIHDFIRECDGVGGFVGSTVGSTKRQINRPKPVDEIDMEAIFKQAKEEQEKHEKEFEEEQRQEQILKSGASDVESKVDSDGAAVSATDSKPKLNSWKSSDPIVNGSSKKKVGKLVPGSVVRVVSGNFADFEGSVKTVSRKTKKATVAFTLFGKESLVDLDVDEIVVQ